MFTDFYGFSLFNTISPSPSYSPSPPLSCSEDKQQQQIPENHNVDTL